MGKASETMGKAVGKAHAAAARMKGDKGIFMKLQEEHAEVSTLMKRISATDDEKTRRDLFPKIRKELLAHAKAEEEQFYPLLKNNDSTRHLGEHAEKEHHEVEQILDELQALDFSTKQWGEKFEMLKKNVEKHVDEEEHTIFPKAQDIFSDEEAKVIEQAYTNEKEQQMRAIS